MCSLKGRSGRGLGNQVVNDVSVCVDWTSGPVSGIVIEVSVFVDRAIKLGQPMTLRVTSLCLQGLQEGPVYNIGSDVIVYHDRAIRVGQSIT